MTACDLSAIPKPWKVPPKVRVRSVLAFIIQNYPISEPRKSVTIEERHFLTIYFSDSLICSHLGVFLATAIFCCSSVSMYKSNRNKDGINRCRAYFNVQLFTICAVVKSKCSVKCAVAALLLSRLPGFVQL